jgi:hypothetical protein
MTSESGIPHNWLKNARSSISSAMYSNGVRDDRSQSFITQERLKEVWMRQRNSSCLLDEFLQYLPKFSRDEVQNFLLNIISILVFIHWDDWPSFTGYFGLARGKFKDEHLPLSAEQCEEVFRSSPSDGSEFRQIQYAFIPVQIQQNSTRALPETEWRLPLTSEGQKNETGSYGTVTKVIIAKGYFRNRNGKMNDEVRSGWKQAIFNKS